MLGKSALTFAVVAITLGSGAAHAEMIGRTGTFGGREVTYKVVLPNGYEPGTGYPIVLHLVGGPQTLEIVQSSTSGDWQALAEERGLIVVSPAAPDGELFFRGGDVIFPEFLDAIADEYGAPEGGFHITGHSNGGLSAFHVASLYPERFISVTGYPGFLGTEERLVALDGLCVFMHVGDRDPSWLRVMEEQAAELEARGHAVVFTIEPDQIHRLDTSRDDLARRLFDELASAREGCS